LNGITETIDAKALTRGQVSRRASLAEPKSLVYVLYQDHVLYHRGDPNVMKPQTRECVGWLVYEELDYVIICWDRDAGAPTLKGGDPKASGLLILRSDIGELRRLKDG
jgi:hypothetical protein